MLEIAEPSNLHVTKKVIYNLSNIMFNFFLYLILGKIWKSKVLSTDHSPSNDEEYQRIQQ